jgi:hypothetical protein
LRAETNKYLFDVIVDLVSAHWALSENEFRTCWINWLKQVPPKIELEYPLTNYQTKRRMSSKIRKIEHAEHILLRPDFYIGSDTNQEQKMWVCNGRTTSPQSPPSGDGCL